MLETVNIFLTVVIIKVNVVLQYAGQILPATQILANCGVICVSVKPSCRCSSFVNSYDAMFIGLQMCSFFGPKCCFFFASVFYVQLSEISCLYQSSSPQVCV